MVQFKTDPLDWPTGLSPYGDYCHIISEFFHMIVPLSFFNGLKSTAKVALQDSVFWWSVHHLLMTDRQTLCCGFNFQQIAFKSKTFYIYWHKRTMWCLPRLIVKDKEEHFFLLKKCGIVNNETVNIEGLVFFFKMSWKLKIWIIYYWKI